MVRRSENVVEYFDRTAKVFTANYRGSPEFREREHVWRRAVHAALPRLSGGAVCLDLGCGDGSLSRWVAAAGYSTVGFDQSEAMLTLASARAAHTGAEASAQYVCASLPLSADTEARYAGAAGMIICSSVLEYLDDPEAVVRQCHRLLRPGGTLLVSIPNRGSVYRVCERALRSVLAFNDSYVRHQRHQFSLDDVEGLLARAGYDVTGATFFSLPLQRYSERVFAAYRGSWLATMILVTADKRPDIPEGDRS